MSSVLVVMHAGGMFPGQKGRMRINIWKPLSVTASALPAASHSHLTSPGKPAR